MNDLAPFFCQETVGCTGDVRYGGHILACRFFDHLDYGYHSREAYEAHVAAHPWRRLEACPRCSQVTCGLERAPMRVIGEACQDCGCTEPVSAYPVEPLPGYRVVGYHSEDWKPLGLNRLDPMAAHTFPPALKQELRKRKSDYVQQLASELTNAVHRELPESRMVLLPPSEPTPKRKGKRT